VHLNEVRKARRDEVWVVVDVRRDLDVDDPCDFHFRENRVGRNVRMPEPPAQVAQHDLQQYVQADPARQLVGQELAAAVLQQEVQVTVHEIEAFPK
jgi:hypothetical protein